MSFRLFVFFCIACFFQSLLIDRTKKCSCEELEEKDCSIRHRPDCSWINQTCVQNEPSFFNDASSCINSYFCWTLDNKCEEITDCTRCNGTYCPEVCERASVNKTTICQSKQVSIDECPTITDPYICDKGERYCEWISKEEKCQYLDIYDTCQDSAKNQTCDESCEMVDGICQSKSTCKSSQYCENIPYNRTHQIFCYYQNKTCTAVKEIPKDFTDRNQSSCPVQTKWVKNTCQQCENLVTSRFLLLKYLLPKDWPPVGNTTIGNSSQSENSTTNSNSTSANSTSGNTNDSNTTQQANQTGEGSPISAILVRSLVILIIMLN